MLRSLGIFLISPNTLVEFDIYSEHLKCVQQRKNPDQEGFLTVHPLTGSSFI